MDNTPHRARKRFGQNFLTDAQVIAEIIAAIDPKADDSLVEIGPGQAALTRPLLKSGCQLDVVEIDRDLAATLREGAMKGSMGTTDTLIVHEADVLQFDFEALAEQRGQPLRIVGNLPYNISSPLLFRLLPLGKRISDMHFMLQREVVQRMAAGPGSKTYGRLSVMVQACCDVEALFDVPPSAFTPPPKVDSAIVRLTPLSEPMLDSALAERLSTLTRAAFAQRRKTLRNSVSEHFDSSQLQALGIDPKLRAEALSVAEFIHLARNLTPDQPQAAEDN